MIKYYAVGAIVLVAGFAGATYYYAFRSVGDYSGCGAMSVAGAGTIGGPFSLMDKTGTGVTDKDVISEPSLVYFGYSFCPDVCPFDNVRNADAVDLLAEFPDAVSTTPIFITVDPERDTPEAVGEYAEAFHPKMVGLTGTMEQVKSAADAYRVYFEKQEAEDEFYLVDHTTFTYLVLPEEGVVDIFRRGDAAEEISRRVACVADKSRTI